MNADPSAPWWWLLLALVAVAALTAALRLWVQSRGRSGRVTVAALVPAPPAPAQLAQAAPAAPMPPTVQVPQAPPSAPAPTDPAFHRLVSAQDALTGLASRLQLEDRLDAAALRAESHQRRLALLYIDIDGFKPINESYGYEAGDALLREVAQRLTGLGRSTDTLARMGADEFIMLMDGDPDHASAALVADRIRQALQRPYLLQGREVHLSCSIGIVLYPDHGPRARLIARADAAMLAAKRAGGNIHCFFADTMDPGALEAIELQRDLRRALETNTGLELHYQPKIDSRSGRISGVEALLRWHHPERGAVSPVVFVPVAERFGLIGALGQWVTDEACRQLRIWQDTGLRMHVAINLSVHQLRQTDLVERVQGSLARHDIAGGRVTFEVTESAAMEDPQASLRVFERLAQLGVSLSIDDFGTGYSSLSYLRRLPARQLKIDRSFVQDVATQEDAQAIVRAVIKLAHALGLKVVAEGVETVAQQDVLKRMGCDQLQGFLFAKPMPARHLQLWVMGDGVPARQMQFRDSQFEHDDTDGQRPDNDGDLI